MNHLVRWELDTKALQEEGKGIGNLKNRNLALLFKWSWRFLKEPDAFWCKVVKTIHGVDLHQWLTSGKFGRSLRSQWINI